MNKKILIGILLSLSMVVGVLATVTPTNPIVDETTNADTYDFTATTDNPLVAGGVHIDLDLGGIIPMPCVWNVVDYTCELLAEDISGLEGIYPVTMTDADGTFPAATLTIDQVVVAYDFGFSATDYVVNYILDCDCDPSGCDVVSTGQYSTDNFISDINDFNPGFDFSVLGAGDYEFRGYCKDLATNEDYTGITTFTLPATPPVLIEVIDLPSTTVCSDVITCASPLAYGPLDGLGNPLDISFKVTFDKSATITLTFDGGVSVGPSDSFTEHVVLLGSVTEGVGHTLSIDASDGINSDVYNIVFDVTGTGVGGGVTIDIRDSIPVDPTNPAIEIIDIELEKNQVLPGDFALVNYTIFMVKGEYTRFSFIGDADFEAPITLFCEEDYDGENQDIVATPINPIYEIDPLDGTFDEATKLAITCPYIGDVDAGLEYKVIAKYPISSTAIGGTLSGTFDVGLYDVPDLVP